MKTKLSVFGFVLSVGFVLGQVSFAGEPVDTPSREPVEFTPSDRPDGSVRPIFAITETGPGELLAVLDQGDKVRVMFLVKGEDGMLNLAVDVTVADGVGTTQSIAPEALERSAGITEPLAATSGGSASCSSGGNAICCAFTIGNRARMICICWSGQVWHKCFDSDWLAVP